MRTHQKTAAATVILSLAASSAIATAPPTQPTGPNCERLRGAARSLSRT